MTAVGAALVLKLTFFYSHTELICSGRKLSHEPGGGRFSCQFKIRNNYPYMKFIFSPYISVTRSSFSRLPKTWKHFPKVTHLFVILNCSSSNRFQHSFAIVLGWSDKELPNLWEVGTALTRKKHCSVSEKFSVALDDAEF